MSPKRKLAAAQQDTRQGDDSDNFDSDITSWNDEPAHFALWHNKLPEYLTDYDDSFSSLVQHGHVWSKHVMVFASTNHIHRYRQGMLTAGTFYAPLVISRTSAVVLDRAPVDLTVSDDAAHTAAREAELNELKRFGLGPEQIDKKDKEMARAIVRKMSNPSSRKSWLKRANHSGRALLNLLQAERVRLDSDLQTGIGENVVEAIDKLFREGVAEATVASFGEFDHQLSEHLDVLPSSLRPAYADEACRPSSFLRS